MYKYGYYLKFCFIIYCFKIKSKLYFNQNILFLEYEKLILYLDVIV